MPLSHESYHTYSEVAKVFIFLVFMFQNIGPPPKPRRSAPSAADDDADLWTHARRAGLRAGPRQEGPGPLKAEAGRHRVEPLSTGWGDSAAKDAA